MATRLVPEDGGWLRWTGEPTHLGVVRVRARQAADGRWHLTALCVEGSGVEGSVSAEALRAVPVGRIEATLNSQMHAPSSQSGSRVRTARVPDRLRANAVSGYPDAFYEAVATIYRGLVGSSSSP